MVSQIGTSAAVWRRLFLCIAWISTAATAFITLGLIAYGVKGEEPIVA